MAEILVSDFCDDRPDAGNGGRAFAFDNMTTADRRRQWAERARARAGGPDPGRRHAKNEKAGFL